MALNRRLLGGRVHIQGSSWFTKAPRLGEATPYHQDLFLWSNPASGPNALRTRPHKMGHLSTWVALERVDRDNGCLFMVPGSHARGVVEHETVGKGVHPEIARQLQRALPPEQQVAVELEPGDAVVWAPAMWHMSPPNVSDRTRWGGVMVTFPADAAAAALQAGRPLILDGGAACPWPGLGEGAGVVRRSAPGGGGWVGVRGERVRSAWAVCFYYQ